MSHDQLSDAVPGDSGASVKWYVRKPDGSVYGPETAAVLLEWAAESRIVSGNEVSRDKKHWIAAEDLPYLQMDWMAESPDGGRYGPFNVLATRELCEHEVLSEDAALKNIKTGEKSSVAEQLKSQPGRHQDVLFEESAQAEAPVEASSSKRKRRKKPAEEGVPVAEAGALQQQVEELGTQRKQLEKKVRQQQKLLKQQEDALDVVRRDQAQEQEALRNEVEQLREQLDATGEDPSGTAVEQLQEEVRSLTEALRKAQETTARVQGRIDGKEQERRALEDAADKREQELLEQLEFLQAETAGLRLQIEEQAASVAGQAAATGRVAELEERVATADAQLNDSMARLNRAETSVSNAESRHRTEKTDLENRFSRTRRQLGSVEMALRQSRHRVSILSVMTATLVVLVFVFIVLYVRTKHNLGSLRERVASITGVPAEEVVGGEDSDPGAGTPPGTPSRATGSRPAPSGYPRISVPGIRTTFSGKRCMMVFDKPVFSSLTTISPEAGGLLGKLSGQIRDYMPGFKLTVRGHTDNTPLRSSRLYPDNEALGLARAKAVVDVMQKRYKLPAGSLRAASAGDQAPPFPNDTAENRQKNRTVVLILERK